MKLRKVMKRLLARRADFDKGPQSTNSADRQRGRWTAKGYHRPGSNNK